MTILDLFSGITHVVLGFLLFKLYSNLIVLAFGDVRQGDVQVGKSYEIHYVHSSAGMDNNATDA